MLVRCDAEQEVRKDAAAWEEETVEQTEEEPEHKVDLIFK